MPFYPKVLLKFSFGPDDETQRKGHCLSSLWGLSENEKLFI